MHMKELEYRQPIKIKFLSHCWFQNNYVGLLCNNNIFSLPLHYFMRIADFQHFNMSMIYVLEFIINIIYRLFKNMVQCVRKGGSQELIETIILVKEVLVEIEV